MNNHNNKNNNELVPCFPFPVCLSVCLGACQVLALEPGSFENCSIYGKWTMCGEMTAGVNRGQDPHTEVTDDGFRSAGSRESTCSLCITSSKVSDLGG